jgi:CRISPR-associated protein Csm2
MARRTFKKIDEFDPTWLADAKGLHPDSIDFAEWFGEYLCDKKEDTKLGFNALTTSQIRNFFGEIKRIQAKGIEKSESTSFLLIRPKLAYAEARVKAKSGLSSRIIDFRKIMEKAHGVVTDGGTTPQLFQNFVDFLEAILAYHKAAGGRD